MHSGYIRVEESVFGGASFVLTWNSDEKTENI